MLSSEMLSILIITDKKNRKESKSHHTSQCVKITGPVRLLHRKFLGAFKIAFYILLITRKCSFFLDENYFLTLCSNQNFLHFWYAHLKFLLHLAKETKISSSERLNWNLTIITLWPQWSQRLINYSYLDILMMSKTLMSMLQLYAISVVSTTLKLGLNLSIGVHYFRKVKWIFLYFLQKFQQRIKNLKGYK